MPDEPDLAAFVRAQLDHDAYIAHQAKGLLGVENAWWTWDALKARFPGLSRADCLHIEQHGPHRVLADLESKRLMLAALLAMPHPGPGATSCSLLREQPASCDCGRDESVARMIRLLAAPFAGRPGWLPEWGVS